ncbi:MAG: hypothetical protein P8M73_08155 [Luminiphilus sp.]|jgi:hypothetical protein|nr:hypothetical protein [Luminiphilus sp.]
MTMSFLGLLILAIAGSGLYHQFNRRMNWELPPCVELGAGVFIGAVMASSILGSGVLSVTQSSQLVVALCLVASGVLLLGQRAIYRSTLSYMTGLATPSRVGSLLILAIAAYLLLILVNNLSRDVFPWDAFTTWMYRAKAWVTTNRALEFVSLDHWLHSGAAGYAVAAAQYPTAVSAIAAFSAAMAGGWSDQAASLPWFFASLANALLMIGLCKLQKPDNALIPITAGTLLATAPLVHLHGVLAGYADIWVMGTSGMGLAGLCIWMRQRSAAVLFLSLLLLGLGCFWKTEGWLWLTLGALVIGFQMLWQAFGLRLLFITFLLVALSWLLQPINFGALGIWGIDVEGIKLGALGTVAIRPYNPLGDYLRMTLLQGNFLLIVPLYLGAILCILISERTRLSGYLFMSIGIAICHAFIFGLSAHSEYAQIGTAINRLLVQTVPVFIVTITAAIHITVPTGSAGNPVVGRNASAKLREGLITAIGTAAVSLPLVLLLFSPTGHNDAGKATPVAYPASELRPVVGDLAEGPKGHQFVGDGLPIGVAAAPMTSSGTLQPRFLITDSWMAAPETVSFYWINTDAPRVHSTPVRASGDSLMDMADYPDFWQKPIKEMGYMVQPGLFPTTALGPLSFSNSLLDAAPAVLNHWMTPEPINQRLINMTAGHIESPIALQSWLTVAFLLVCLLGGLWVIRSRTQQARATTVIIVAAGILWLVGSAAHFNQVLTLTTPLLSGSSRPPDRQSPDGSHLRELSTFIANSLPTAEQAVFTIGLDENGRFDAERLPFMLLPLRAASITEAQLAHSDPNLQGTLVLFGEDKDHLGNVATRLVSTKNQALLHQGEGYVMLSMGSK